MRQKILLILTIFIFILGCAVNPIVQDKPIDDSNNPPTPIKNIYWEDSVGDYIQFYTNDSLNQGNEGKTFFHFCGNETTMDVLEVELIKSSGYGASGSGVIFCASGSMANNDLIAYFISIDVQGYYTIRAIDKTVTQTIIEWISTPFLNQGKGQINKIRVEYADANKFELCFNGHNGVGEVITFPENPDEFIKLTGGKYGFCVGVSKHDDFPAVPVDVKFKLLTPVD